MTFPRPYLGFNLNMGYEGIIDTDEEVAYYTTQDPVASLKLDTSITIVTVQEPIFAEADDRVVTFNKFKTWYAKGLNLLKGTGGTLVVDTATELHDLVMAATLEELHKRKYKGREDFQPSGFDYGDRNDMMARIYTAPLRVPGINAVFIHTAKDEYNGKDKTGRKEINAWNGTSGQVQVQIAQYREGKTFKGRIELCRFSPELEGQVIEPVTYAEVMDWLK